MELKKYLTTENLKWLLIALGGFLVIRTVSRIMKAGGDFLHAINPLNWGEYFSAENQPTAVGKAIQTGVEKSGGILNTVSPLGGWALGRFVGAKTSGKTPAPTKPKTKAELQAEAKKQATDTANRYNRAKVLKDLFVNQKHLQFSVKQNIRVTENTKDVLGSYYKVGERSLTTGKKYPREKLYPSYLLNNGYLSCYDYTTKTYLHVNPWELILS